VSGGIISKNIRRFGRTTKGVLEGVRWLEDRGAVFISCEEKLDTSTPMGRFVLTILAALGQMELEERAVGWKTKRDSLVLSGKSVAKIPFGYAKGERGELVPDPKTRDYLVGVFQPGGLPARHGHRSPTGFRTRASRSATRPPRGSRRTSRSSRRTTYTSESQRTAMSGTRTRIRRSSRRSFGTPSRASAITTDRRTPIPRLMLRSAAGTSAARRAASA